MILRNFSAVWDIWTSSRRFDGTYCFTVGVDQYFSGRDFIVAILNIISIFDLNAALKTSIESMIGTMKPPEGL